MKKTRNIQNANSIVRELRTIENYDYDNHEYVNITFLLELWNKTNPSCKKQIKEFLSLERTNIVINDLNALNPKIPNIYSRKEGNTKIYYFSKELFLEFKLWLFPILPLRTINYISHIVDGMEIRSNKYFIEIPILNKIKRNYTRTK